ncbi:MAG: hypothetical protein IID54_05800 [Proteobacteria bacterium]|nr:hypothetical protein [Pseudomonadota bacterium]
MPARKNPAADEARGASEFVQVARLNTSEFKPDNEEMQAAPVFDPAFFPILARHWPSAEARWAA